MDPISGLGSATTTESAPADRYSELSSQDFVKIMFTELGHQDPLQPSDSKALLEQLSSLRDIQSSMDLGAKLEGLVAQNQAMTMQNELSAAAGLIGKYISGLDEGNNPVYGTVFSVSRTPEGAILNLYDGKRVPMNQLSEIVNPPDDGATK